MSFFDYVENLSYRIGDYIGRNDNEEDKELFRYSVFSILSQLITFGFGFGLSVLFKYPLEYIFVIFTFVLLRSNAGGYHCQTYRDCFFTSNTLYLIGCLISLLFNEYHNILLIISILSGIYILPICPKPSENSPSRGRTEDLRFRKRYSLSFIFIIILNLIFINLNMFDISSSISSGVIISSFIVSDFGEYIIKKVIGYQK